MIELCLQRLVRLVTAKNNFKLQDGVIATNEDRHLPKVRSSQWAMKYESRMFIESSFIARKKQSKQRSKEHFYYTNDSFPFTHIGPYAKIKLH